MSQHRKCDNCKTEIDEATAGYILSLDCIAGPNRPRCKMIDLCGYCTSLVRKALISVDWGEHTPPPPPMPKFRPLKPGIERRGI